VPAPFGFLGAKTSRTLRRGKLSKIEIQAFVFSMSVEALRRDALVRYVPYFLSCFRKIVARLLFQPPLYSRNYPDSAPDCSLPTLASATIHLPTPYSALYSPCKI
jgi:hypothetical protein